VGWEYRGEVRRGHGFAFRQHNRVPRPRFLGDSLPDHRLPGHLGQHDRLGDAQVTAPDCSACTELVRGRGELVRVLDTMPSEPTEHALIDTADLADCIERLYRGPELVRQYAAAGVEFARCRCGAN